MTTAKQHWSDEGARQPTHGLGRDTPRPTPKRPLWWVAWLIVLAGLVAVCGPLFWGDRP